jgi:hypothetical protein
MTDKAYYTRKLYMTWLATFEGRHTCRRCRRWRAVHRVSAKGCHYQPALVRMKGTWVRP